jgi:DNA-binding beta-propeller fold protein YncE
VAVNSVTDMIYVANEGSNNVTVISGSPTAVRPEEPQFRSPALDFKGTIAIYSLNGRELLKTAFSGTAAKESILNQDKKALATGVYKYRVFNDRTIMDEGSFMIK